MGRFNLVSRMARSALIFSTISEMLLPLIRSVALARILGPEQFGLGVTLSVVYGIAEQTTDIGINFSAVRADTRNNPGLLFATLQGLMLLRGAGLAAVLVLISPLMALAFSAPQAVWAYALLGVSMFFRGFGNLGIKEVMRSYVFWREACVVAGSQLFWTIVTVVAAFVFKSFYSVIIGIFGNVLSYVLLSHLLSPRKWKLAWNKEFLAEAVAYGRPLMPNGTANAFTQLADRFVIGSVLGVVKLAVYNVAMVTALLPRLAVAKFLITLLMPAFANLGLEEARRSRLYDCWMVLLSLLGFAYGIALLSIGPEMIQLVFGARFRPTSLIMGLIAVNICAKFIDQLPVPAALAYGQTKFIFFGTLASALGVALGIAILLVFNNFDVFIGALAVGEILALLWITLRTIKLHGLTPALTLTVVFAPVTVLSVLVAIRSVVPMDLVTWIALSWIVGLATIILMAMMAWNSGLRLSLLLKDIRRGKTARSSDGQVAISVP